MQAASPGRPDGRRRTGLGAIFLVLFVDLVGFGIVFPLYADMLDWYAGHGLLAWLMGLVDAWFPGQPHWQRAALFGGLLGAAYAGLQFVSAPFWGRLSDRHGRRPILLISLGGSLAANVLWVFSADFALLLVSRLLAGAMTGNVAVANAAVADVTTPENRTRGMAAVGMAFGLGFILGPALGGLLYTVRLDAIPGLAAWGINPFSAPAAIAALLAAANLLWAWRSFAETLPPERRGRDSTTRVRNPLAIFSGDLPARVHAVNLAFCCHTLLFSGMETTLVFFGSQHLGLNALHYGWIFAGMGVLSAAVQGVIVRPHGARLGVARLAMTGFALHVVGFSLIALVDARPALGLLLAGVAVQAVATGLVFPSLATIASLAAPPERQGYAMGTFRSASSLGRALGPLLAAVAYFNAPALPYWLGAAGMLVPLVLVWRLRQPG